MSDGLEARLGTLTAGREWFKPWRTISGEQVEDAGVPQLEVMLKGVFHTRRLLELLRDFIVFEDDGSARLEKPRLPEPAMVKQSGAELAHREPERLGVRAEPSDAVRRSWPGHPRAGPR